MIAIPPELAKQASGMSSYAGMLRGNAIIIACFYSGSALKAMLHLIIPGNVLGLFLLLGLLGSGRVPLEWIEGASKWLLFLLPLLFVPIYVAAAADKELWARWGVLIVLTLVSAVALMWVVVGHLAQWLLKSK